MEIDLQTGKTVIFTLILTGTITETSLTWNTAPGTYEYTQIYKNYVSWNDGGPSWLVFYMLVFNIGRNDLSFFIRPIDFDFYTLNFEI